MNRRTALFVAPLAALAVSAVAFDVNSDFKKWLPVFSKKVASAFAKKDAKFFENCSTADFSYTDASGNTQKKKESLVGMKQMFDMSESVKVSFKILSSSAKGSTGIATFESKFVSVMMPGEDGKKHTMEMTSWTKETYKKSGRTWKIQKIVETKPGKMLMDGKPMDPSMMGGG